MQRQQVGARAWNDRVRTAIFVAEFHQDIRLAERVDHRSNLPACKAVRRPVAQQGDDVEIREQRCSLLCV